jgi:DNA sulfur modification protein DndD
MKIFLINVQNFKQYYGNQQAYVSDSKIYNLTVFHGLNGAGKTSLFNAINWCLYGIGEKDTGEFLNKRALIEANNDDEILLVVTVCFSHENEEYMAERAIIYKKIDEKKAVVEKRNFFLTITGIDGNTKTIGNPEGKLNSILPENVREYFFFDGENIDDLTRPDNEKIENAIINIMRLPIIDKTYDHLEGIANEYRRELKKLGSPQINKIISKEEEFEKELSTKKNQREELIEELRKGKQQISDLKKLLRENEKSHELQKKRDGLSETFATLINHLGSIVEEMQITVVQLFPLFLINHLRASLDIVNEKRERGEIPSGLKEQFINDLLERDTCICGKKISETEGAKEHLLSLINNSSFTQLEDKVIRMPGDIRSINKITNNQYKHLERLCKEKSETQLKIEDFERRIDDINRQLEGSPDIDIAKLEQNLSSFENNQKINESKLARVRFEIEHLEKEINEQVKKREIEERKQKELELLSRKEELARKSSDAVQRIKEEFYEQTRKRIEEETKKVFSDLAWKHDQFQDIRLDPDFHLEVIDMWGLPSREELSAGERQILSLSFICAMAKLSGEEAPIIMDTPFGRLSGNHLETVAKNIPGLVPQLLLLVTDREWNTASKYILEEHVGQLYNLEFNESTGCTTIEEVDFV